MYQFKEFKKPQRDKKNDLHYNGRQLTFSKSFWVGKESLVYARLYFDGANIVGIKFHDKPQDDCFRVKVYNGYPKIFAVNMPTSVGRFDNIEVTNEGVYVFALRN